MEIYADESTERVYVRHDRGPYTVLDRDGTTSESHVPRGADLMYDDWEPADRRTYDEGFEDGRKEGFEDGRQAGYDEALDDAATALLALDLPAKRPKPKAPAVVSATTTGGRL